MKKDKFIFTALHIMAWLIFVGLSIEAGGLLVNFVFSIFKPEVIGHLYQKMDLTGLYAQSQAAFFGVYGLILSIAILKAVLFYWIILLLMKIDLSQPFNEFVSRKVMQISTMTLEIGVLSYIGREVGKRLQFPGIDSDKLHEFWGDHHAFILMAAVLYVIAVIFKRGIALQEENEFTI